MKVIPWEFPFPQKMVVFFLVVTETGKTGILRPGGVDPKYIKETYSPIDIIWHPRWCFLNVIYHHPDVQRKSFGWWLNQLKLDKHTTSVGSIIGTVEVPLADGWGSSLMLGFFVLDDSSLMKWSMKRFERFHRQGKEICIIFCICTSYQNHIIIVVLNRSKWDLFLVFNISFQESALSKISLRSYEFSEALTWRERVCCMAIRHPQRLLKLLLQNWWIQY